MLRWAALAALGAAAAAQETPAPTSVRYHCYGNCDCITGPCPENCHCGENYNGTGHSTMKKCLKDCVAQPITCPQELYRACGSSIGDAAGCQACVQADMANLTKANCTADTQDLFCAIPDLQCAEVLMLSCGSTAGTPAPCSACMQQHAANLTAAGCAQDTLDKFCSVELPAAITCSEALVANCRQAMSSDLKCAACETAHRAALKAANCSELYKTAFCAIPKPACVEQLMLNCGLTVGDADQCKACEAANAADLAVCSNLNLQEFCTLAGEVPAIPPLPPGPAGCAYALAKNCMKQQATAADCAACQAANQAALDDANCTAQELDEFCKAPGPACAVAFAGVCAESLLDEARCKACEQKNAATLTAAKCEAAELAQFCEFTLPPVNLPDSYQCIAGVCVPTPNSVPKATCQAACS